MNQTTTEESKLLIDSFTYECTRCEKRCNVEVTTDLIPTLCLYEAHKDADWVDKLEVTDEQS